MKEKLIRITTLPASMGGLLRGQLLFMTQYYEVIGISSPTGNNSTAIDNMDQVGKDQNTRMIPIAMTRKITPLQDLKATWELYKTFKKEKPLIVHSHTPKAGTLGMFAAYLARVPNRLHTVAGLPLLEVTGSKRILLDFVEKLTYACATKVYPNSFGLKDIIIANKYTSAKKLKVIGQGSSNGVDTSFFDPNLYTTEDKINLRKDIGITKEDYVFIFIGRLVTDKGINELVSAFEKLNQKYTNTKLLFVGSREEELDPLHSNTETILKNNKNIIMVGSQSNVKPYYAMADSLVFPSYREGFPNVVMEAGAMGLPSIVSNINGCNEIILENKNGYIIPVKNSEAIQEKMQVLYLGHQKGESFNADTIRDLIASRYGRKVIWEEILKEYQSLN
ncbi:glycosyltransferase family 4 protein [Maribacter sp.]|uniref:glycosyltransferase family 4 protein n=1 Tax=Maribacter sp. TaxID=1897614 RepID=UPI0025C65A9D|nr:glycosyltransferase family 4 protein [Maribacter sp.]